MVEPRIDSNRGRYNAAVIGLSDRLACAVRNAPQRPDLFRVIRARHNEIRCAMVVEPLELESRPPLTVDEFEALAERQGWDENTPVELLDGELVWMSPTNALTSVASTA
jgi:hypothetical protein